MSTLKIFNKILVAVLLIVLSACDFFDDVPAFLPTGEYKINTTDKKGTVSIKMNGDNTYTFAFKNYGDKEENKVLLDFDLNASIEALNTKAYKITFKNQDFKKESIPFSITLSIPKDITNAITELADKTSITFEDNSIKANYSFTIATPASNNMVSYEGANYMGVIQKDKIEVAYKIISTLRMPVEVNSALLLRTIKDDDTKRAITRLYNYSGPDPSTRIKKQAIKGLIDNTATRYNKAFGKDLASTITSNQKLTLTKQ